MERHLVAVVDHDEHIGGPDHNPPATVGRKASHDDAAVGGDFADHEMYIAEGIVSVFHTESLGIWPSESEDHSRNGHRRMFRRSGLAVPNGRSDRMPDPPFPITGL